MSVSPAFHIAPLGREGAGASEEGHVAGEEFGGPAGNEQDVVESAVRPLRAPQAPTRDEIDAHEASGHCNYRSWCRACIAGRGRSDPHSSASGDEHALPTVAIDYAYLGEPPGEDAERSCPILVLKSGRDRWVSSEVYPAKGTQHEWCANRLAAELAMVPWDRFTLKSDQEPAIMMLKAAAAKIVQSATGKAIVMEDSPVGESQSNGLVEGAVKEVKGIIRSLRWAVEQLHGV